MLQDDCLIEPPVTNQLAGVELDTRNDVFIMVDKIGAVMALKENGPTRLFFVGGGHIDVCGSTEIWRRKIRIAELCSA